MKIEESYGLTEVNSVFEIPIYRLSNSNFENELNNCVVNSIDYSQEDIIRSLGEKEGKRIYDGIWTDIKTRVEYNWKFNEIVGWITICLNQEIIFGELFLKRTDRIRKNSKAKIDFYNCEFKIKFDSKNLNKEIFTKILTAVNKVQKSTKFKNRVIDISKFETIGPYIDWKKLYKSLND